MQQYKISKHSNIFILILRLIVEEAPPRSLLHIRVKQEIVLRYPKRWHVDSNGLFPKFVVST